MSTENSDVVSDVRQDRVRRMLADRLGSVCVIAEAVHRRHNTSAILRSAEAFGVHEVHLITGGFRTSKGAARGAERWLELRRWSNLPECVAHLRERGFRIFIADLADDAHTPDTLPVEGSTAILCGSSGSASAAASSSVVVTSPPIVSRPSSPAGSPARRWPSAVSSPASVARRCPSLNRLVPDSRCPWGLRISTRAMMELRFGVAR